VPAEERTELALAAMSLLIGYYTRECANRDVVCREAVLLFGHWWGASKEVRTWCSGLMLDGADQNIDVRRVALRTREVLESAEICLLAHFLGWFASSDAPMHRFAEDFESVGQMFTSSDADVELFPDAVIEAFALLGVPPTFDSETVTQKYRCWMKLVHPDSLIGIDLNVGEVQEAEALARRLIEARDCIEAYYRALGRSQSKTATDTSR
jgi:DnaJ-domain-containing protein 1